MDSLDTEDAPENESMAKTLAARTTELLRKLKEICERDAENNDFTETDKQLESISKQLNSTKYPNVNKMFQLIYDTTAHYKGSLIESRRLKFLETTKNNLE